MLKKLGCRLVVLAVAALPFLGQPATAVASSGGTLFAITDPSQTLVRIDQTSGAFIPVANLNNPNQPQSFALASDSQDHRLFAVRISVTGTDPVTGFPIFTSELLTFDSQSGAQIYNPAPTFSGFVPQALVFDPSTGTLFGLTFNQLVKVNPATAAITTVVNIPNPGIAINSIALDSSSHTLYLAEESSSEPASTQIFPVDTTTSSIGVGVTTDQAIRQIGIDGGQVYGVTECCPANLVAVNTSTGVTTLIGAVGDSSTIVQFGTAVDPATHNVFINIGHNDPITFAFISQLLVINDQTGASFTLPLADAIASLGFAFETPVSITPDSIIGDVKSALSSGAITKDGIANSLLAKLNEAKAARGRGQCATAALIYQAFINDVNAQSGKAIAPATASQLVSEAQFLIKNCP
jgi:hypothetical protein